MSGLNLRFQSTPPRVAGDYRKPDERLEFKVSIHARVWRATKTRTLLTRWTPCFNPRPRVAGDTRKTAGAGSHSAFQSTPRVWRATQLHPQLTPVTKVSIHARVWRATLRWFMASPAPRFNPRPRVAGDADLNCDELRS